MRLVVPPSTAETNTSPLKIKATSLPLGDTANSRAPAFTGTILSLFDFTSVTIVIFIFSGFELACCVYSSPS